MTKNHWTVLVGTALLCVSAWLIYNLTKPRSLPVQGKEQKVEQAAAPISPNSVKAETKKDGRAENVPILQRSPAAPTDKSTLTEAFFTSDNLRAFIDMAKHHPEKGGHWYARMAGSYCNNIHQFQKTEPQIVPKPGIAPELNQRRQVMYDELARKCQGVTKDDFLSKTLNVEATQQKDIAWLAFYESDDLKKVTAILDLSDPLLLFDAGSSLTVNAPDVTYYEGRKYPHQIMGAAWGLAACEIGMPCGQEHLVLKTHCVISGECYDDMQNFMIGNLQNTAKQAGVDIDSGKGAATMALSKDVIMGLSKSIANNIRKKNVAAFMPPPAK